MQSWIYSFSVSLIHKELTQEHLLTQTEPFQSGLNFSFVQDVFPCFTARVRSSVLPMCLDYLTPS